MSSIPFGYPPLPPVPPVDQIYKRLGIARLECSLVYVDSASGVVDTLVFGLVNLDRKVLNETYEFVFIYSEPAKDIYVNIPCTLSTQDDTHAFIDIKGYKLTTLIDPDKVSTNAYVLYFKKGLLK